jgi:hypothetical protein
LIVDELIKSVEMNYFIGNDGFMDGCIKIRTLRTLGTGEIGGGGSEVANFA